MLSDFDRRAKEAEEKWDAQARKAAWGFLYLFVFGTLFLLTVVPLFFYLMLLAWKKAMG
jgi:hypothetical protein